MIRRRGAEDTENRSGKRQRKQQNFGHFMTVLLAHGLALAMGVVAAVRLRLYGLAVTQVAVTATLVGLTFTGALPT